MALSRELGPYTLVRRLAVGGMAELFLAKKAGPGGFSRDVVIKRILPHLAEDDEFRRLFFEEARIAARLNHPNIVQTFDFGAEEGGHYIAMEFVRGVDLLSLEERIGQRHGRGQVPPQHAALIAAFVCHALSHAHQLRIEGSDVGLVHRDVSPSNILVSFDGTVKITDFGIVKLSHEHARRDATQTNIVRGKYAYMSPEQARGEPLDRRSDLFNVGLLLFEMVTGETFLPIDDPKAARRSVARGQFASLSKVRQMPPALGRITTRALSYRREDRYQEALALRADLLKYLHAQPNPSDEVELGQFVRGLFPTLAREDTALRAAGTIPVQLEVPQIAAAALQAIDARPSTALISGTASPQRASQPPPSAADLDSFVDAKTQRVSESFRRYIHTGDEPKEEPESSNRRMLLGFIGGGVLLTCLGGGLAYLLERKPDEPNRTPPSRDEPPREPPPTARPQAPASPGQLRITTEPAGIFVRVNGAGQGPAPLIVAAQPGTQQVIEFLMGDRVVETRTVVLGDGEARDIEVRIATPAILAVRSEPAGATVTINGQMLGMTPIDLTAPAGDARVFLAKDGYRTAVRDISVIESQRLELSVRLERGADADLPAAGQSAMTGSSTSSGGMSMRRRARGEGTLLVGSTPWSTVFIDGQRKGNTPLRIRLRAGRHRLELRDERGRRKRRTITIVAGRELKVRERF